MSIYGHEFGAKYLSMTCIHTNNIKQLSQITQLVYRMLGVAIGCILVRECSLLGHAIYRHIIYTSDAVKLRGRCSSPPAVSVPRGAISPRTWS